MAEWMEQGTSYEYSLCVPTLAPTASPPNGEYSSAEDGIFISDEAAIEFFSCGDSIAPTDFLPVPNEEAVRNFDWAVDELGT